MRSDTGPSYTVTALSVLLVATGAGFTVFMIQDSDWPAWSWWLDALLSLFMLACLVLRHYSVAGAAGASLAAAAAAAPASGVVDVPHEPGPASALAMAVLIGTAVRHSPIVSGLVCALSGIGLAVMVVVLAAEDGSGLRPAPVLAVAALSVGIVGGALARVVSGVVRRTDPSRS